MEKLLTFNECLLREVAQGMTLFPKVQERMDMIYAKDKYRYFEIAKKIQSTSLVQYKRLDYKRRCRFGETLGFSLLQKKMMRFGRRLSKPCL